MKLLTNFESRQSTTKQRKTILLWLIYNQVMGPILGLLQQTFSIKSPFVMQLYTMLCTLGYSAFSISGFVVVGNMVLCSSPVTEDVPPRRDRSSHGVPPSVTGLVHSRSVPLHPTSVTGLVHSPSVHLVNALHAYMPTHVGALSWPYSAQRNCLHSDQRNYVHSAQRNCVHSDQGNCVHSDQRNFVHSAQRK